MTSLKAIRDAIVTQIIQKINGTTTCKFNLSTLLPQDGRALAKPDGSDKTYPKLVLPVDAGTIKPLPSLMRSRTATFDGVLVFKEPDDKKSTLQDPMCDLIDDLDVICLANNTLGGLVDQFYMTQFTTDSGFAFPEACVWIKFYVEYRARLGQ